MHSSTSAQSTISEPQGDLKAQLAQFIEHQPKSTQKYHRWMKRLEVASAGIIVAAFIAAMYVSINSTNVPPMTIPVAWFLLVASVTPAIVLAGVHTLVLGAFPPIVLPGKKQRFITGRAAAWQGWGLVLGGLAGAAFWVTLSYAAGTFNMAMLEPPINLLGTLLGVVITVSVLYSVYRVISHSR